MVHFNVVVHSAQSLSARRAWIEIGIKKTLQDFKKSLSARRAWIEISFPTIIQYAFLVALRKESVDRNNLLDLPNV